MKSLIPSVRAEAISNDWMNKKCAQFQFNETEVWYQLFELELTLTSKGIESTYIINPSERNKGNCPVIAFGFVAYLIRNWHRPEPELQIEFTELCKSDFKKKYDAHNLDFDAKFYEYLVENETKRVEYSKRIFQYLTDDDRKLISQCTKSYFDFIKKEQDKQPSDHSVLWKALSEYITGIKAFEFTNIIEYHLLTPGTPKAIWSGKKADAHRFATISKMKLPKFNKCFSFPDGTKLRHNDKNETNSPINAILEAYFKK